MFKNFAHVCNKGDNEFSMKKVIINDQRNAILTLLSTLTKHNHVSKPHEKVTLMDGM